MADATKNLASAGGWIKLWLFDKMRESGAIFDREYGSDRIVMTPSDSLPADLSAAHAMILEQRERLAEEQALRTMLQSEAKIWALEIERLKFMLAPFDELRSAA